MISDKMVEGKVVEGEEEFVKPKKTLKRKIESDVRNNYLVAQKTLFKWFSFSFALGTDF